MRLDSRPVSIQRRQVFEQSQLTSEAPMTRWRPEYVSSTATELFTSGLPRVSLELVARSGLLRTRHTQRLRRAGAAHPRLLRRRLDDGDDGALARAHRLSSTPVRHRLQRRLPGPQS